MTEQIFDSLDSYMPPACHPSNTALHTITTLLTVSSSENFQADEWVEIN